MLLQVVPYAQDELVLVVPRGDPLAGQTAIDKDELYNLTFVTLNQGSTAQQAQEQALHQHGITWRTLNIDMVYCLSMTAHKRLAGSQATCALFSWCCSTSLLMSCKLAQSKSVLHIQKAAGPKHASLMTARDTWACGMALPASSCNLTGSHELWLAPCLRMCLWSVAGVQLG